MYMYRNGYGSRLKTQGIADFSLSVPSQRSPRWREDLRLAPSRNSPIEMEQKNVTMMSDEREAAVCAFGIKVFTWADGLEMFRTVFFEPRMNAEAPSPSKGP